MLTSGNAVGCVGIRYINREWARLWQPAKISHKINMPARALNAWICQGLYGLMAVLPALQVREARVRNRVLQNTFRTPTHSGLV